MNRYNRFLDIIFALLINVLQDMLPSSRILSRTSGTRRTRETVFSALLSSSSSATTATTTTTYESFSPDFDILSESEKNFIDGNAFIGNDVKSGRGIYATRELRKGEKVMITQKPITSHPTLVNSGSLCYLCCAEIRTRDADELGVGVDDDDDDERFCTRDCAREANDEFMRIEKKLNTREIEKYCRERELKFPLLALRIAMRAMQKAEDVHEAKNKRKCLKTFSSVAESLVQMRVEEEQILPQWKEEHEMLIKTLDNCSTNSNEKEEALIKEIFSLRWYSDLTTRFHLNSFKIEYPRTSRKNNDTTNTTFQEMLEKSLTNSISGVSCGTAIYGIPSLINHSCSPNVNIAFNKNHLLDLTVASDKIKQGEALTISYIDNDDDFIKRRNRLVEAYGFHCECQRCLLEESSKT
jgi:hypothetical protein